MFISRLDKRYLISQTIDLVQIMLEQGREMAALKAALNQLADDDQQKLAELKALLSRIADAMSQNGAEDI